MARCSDSVGANAMRTCEASAPMATFWTLRVRRKTLTMGTVRSTFYSTADVVSGVHDHGEDENVCRCMVAVLGAERERERKWPLPHSYSPEAEELDNDNTSLGAAANLHGDDNTI